jgi:2',3'-cyclic-nucleotide 2'-phosphodiesterase (5'-nucleotidase family)
VRRLVADNMRGGRAKLQVSGLTVKYYPAKDGAPERVVVEKDGKELAADAKITVATNNYLTTGGTGGQVFAEAEASEDTMQPIRDLLIKDVRERSIKEMPKGGRIIRAE